MLQTVHKVAEVLNLYSVEHPAWSVGEVAKELQFPKSSTSELMSSLASQGILCRVGKGRYQLGWRLFELSQILLETSKFRIEARRVLEELVEEWKETTHLAVLDGAQAVYLEKLQPAPAVKIPISWTGARLPAHCSGVGKVLLAHSEWEDVVKLLEHQGLPKFTSNTITDLNELEIELEKVRRQGYAYDMEETTVGLCCVAAPIRDRNDRVIASASISVPSFRFESNVDEYTAAILKTTQSISSNISQEPGKYLLFEETA